MIKAKNKLYNLSESIKRLREAIVDYKKATKDTLYRDGLIQRFEFTFELAWKTTAECLRDQGVLFEIFSPKSVYRSAYNAGYINDESVWLNMLEDRNKTSHIYDESIATEIADRICTRYAKEISELLNTLLKFSN